MTLALVLLVAFVAGPADPLPPPQVQPVEGVCENTKGQPFPCVVLHRDDYRVLVKFAKECPQ